MAAGEAGGAGEMLNGIVQTAETIRELVNRWHEAQSSRKEYPRKVKCLEERNGHWNRIVKKYGLAKDKAFMASLGYAQNLLEKELQKIRSASDDTLSKLQEPFFPSLIGRSINEAIQAYDDVQKKLDEPYYLEVAAQRKVLASDPTLSFSKHDHRYVPLERTEQGVKTALLDQNGSKVILLHGGPGKGKSTLARSLALQIQPGIGAQKEDDSTLPPSAPLDINVQSTENQRPARSIWVILRNLLARVEGEGEARNTRADSQTSPPDPPNVPHDVTAIPPQPDGDSGWFGQVVRDVIDGTGAVPSSGDMIDDSVSGSPVVINDAVLNAQLEKTGATQLSDVFDEVVFLECSMDSADGFVQREPEIVQRELRHRVVGWTEDAGGVEAGELETSLRSLLHDRKALIILDNVWDPRFLGRIVGLTEGASNVRWLVTSQKKTLCERLNFSPTPICMETASLEDARRIFVRHIRRSQDEKTTDTFPQQVQGLADELIEKVDTNLLAIACLATGISPENIDDVEEWKEIRRDYFHLLSSRDTAMIFNVEYPCSYWAAMQFCFKRLDEGVQRLLVLVGLCEATSVPQEVLEYLYGKTSQRMDFRAFKTAKRELEAKDLLQVRDNNCSIHDLLRKFVNDHEDIQECKKSMLIELSTSNGVSDSEAEILKAVIFLYLKRSFTVENLDFKIRIDMDGETRRRKRHVLEPVMRLLVKDETDWTANYCKYTRQVFLKYVYDDCVDEEVVGMLFRGADSGERIFVMEFLGRCYNKRPISHIMPVGDGILSSYREIFEQNVVKSNLFYWTKEKKRKGDQL